VIPGFRYFLFVLLETAALCPLVSLPTVLAQGGKAEESIKLQDGKATIKSSLKADDEKDTVLKQPCKVFTVRFKEGQTYRIDMVSKEIDSYLRLEDSTGKELAKDDDSGGFVNARINFPCRKDGDYRVICTTFGGGTGTFSLSVQENAPAKPAALMLQDGKARVEAKLTSTDAMDAVQTNSVCKIFAIKLTKGKSYQIDMMSKDVDSFLRLQNAAGKELAKDDDSGGGHDARIQFDCLETGEYWIIATTYFGGTGGFTLAVQEK
jgi:hypothetical protein